MKRFVILLAKLFIVFPVFSQHARGDKTTSSDYATVLKAADLPTRDLTDIPSSWSLKKYAPVPGNQGDYGTCAAWSSAYAARSISYAVQRKLTDMDSTKQFVFSPGYLYYKIKDASDVNCSAGAPVTKAMEMMTQKGIMLNEDGPAVCNGSVTETEEKEKAAPYKIKDFLSLTGTYGKVIQNDILKIKKSLSENKPVVISIKSFPSFDTVSSSGLWNTVPNEPELGGHAMCVVGYDDTKAGGAFEVLNSWGTGWGNNGFFWLTYEQMITYGNYAVEMMDHEVDKLEISGNIAFTNIYGKTFPVVRTKINSRNIPMGNDRRADFSLYRFTDTLKSKAEFKMKFSTSAPSYVYVFAEDNKGVISRLFPADSTISAAINSTHATYYFPTDSTHAQLDPPAGKENFCILYSKSDIDYEELIRYIKESGVSTFQAVKTKLAKRLLDLKKVKFRDDAISFQAPTEDRSVLCLFIEMNHF